MTARSALDAPPATVRPRRRLGEALRLVFTMTDQPGEPGRLAITVEFSPTASGTHMHMTQEAPDFTPEQRKATIVGWQTFLDVLQQITEAA